eukprot:scaffold1498_cov314-Prasinococcus_capsulatus_cf.AAC.4
MSTLASARLGAKSIRGQNTQATRACNLPLRLLHRLQPRTKLASVSNNRTSPGRRTIHRHTLAVQSSTRTAEDVECDDTASEAKVPGGCGVLAWPA